MIFNYLKIIFVQRVAGSYKQHLAFSHSTEPPWKIIFYGTDSLSENVLKALNLNRLSSVESRIVKDIDVVCIETGCAVRKFAHSHGIKIHTWPFELQTDTYDVGVVASFGHLIPAKSILSCKYGMINAHPSLLPRWRGAAPIVHTILNGDAETGVSIVQVSPNKFDVGKILLQEKCTIPPQCTSEQLTVTLSELCAQLVLKTLHNLTMYINLGVPQANEGVVYARKIKPENGALDWEKYTTHHIERKFRAYKGFVNIYSFWKSMKVSLLELTSPEEVLTANIVTLAPKSISHGYCYFHKKRKIFYVKCQDGWIGIKRIKIPKSGELSAQEFHDGYISKMPIKDRYFYTEPAVT